MSEHDRLNVPEGLGAALQPPRPVSEHDERPPHHALADLHAYVIPVTPKMLLETLCVAEFALNQLEKARPGMNAGGPISTHTARLRHLMDECERKRPTGRGGKHGDLHTSECGCDSRRSG